MRRPLYFAAGLTSMATGIVGAFLPVLPTVPLLLLAAFCFARSNPEWEARLLRHPRWGPPITDWRERRAISRRAKLAALATLGISGLVAVLALTDAWLVLALVPIVAAGVWIATRAE
jgi:uncharacterized membrane protein YbaN (DUF454 family)